MVLLASNIGHFSPQILLDKANHMIMPKIKGDEKCHLSECLGKGEKLQILVTINNAFLHLTSSAARETGRFPTRTSEHGGVLSLIHISEPTRLS